MDAQISQYIFCLVKDWCSLWKQLGYKFFWIAGDKYVVCKACADTKNMKNTTTRANLWNNSIENVKFPRETLGINESSNLIQ